MVGWWSEHDGDLCVGLVGKKAMSPKCPELFDGPYLGKGAVGTRGKIQNRLALIFSPNSKTLYPQSTFLLFSLTLAEQPNHQLSSNIDHAKVFRIRLQTSQDLQMEAVSLLSQSCKK